MNQKNTFRKVRANRITKKTHKQSAENNIILNRILTKCFGLFLQGFVIFLIISLCSYIFTYQNDQIIVESYLKNIPLDASYKVKNLCGLNGAILSYISIFKYFGLISSFLVAMLLLFYGMKLTRYKFLYKINIWRITAIFGYLIFIINSCIGIFHLEGNFSGFLSKALGYFLLNNFGIVAYFIIPIGFVFLLLLIKPEKRSNNDKKDTSNTTITPQTDGNDDVFLIHNQEEKQ